MHIDAHHHLWDPARGDYGWLDSAPDVLRRPFGPADLHPVLEATGITGTVLVQAAPTAEETAYLLSIAEAEPAILGVVGWVDLKAPDAAEKVAALMAHPKAVGLRPMLQDIEDTEWILDPACGPALAALEAAGGVFDALGLVRHERVLDTFAAAHPGLSIVLDHALKPDIAAGGFVSWAPGISALARRENVTCKLSGLLTEAAEGADARVLAPYVDHLLGAFGPDRLMFGSDWPVLLMAGQDYAAWHAMAQELTEELTAEERAAVFGGTAARVYGLEGAV